MKKRFLISFFLLLAQVFAFAEDYRCTFVYRVATSSGTGKCSEGTDPIVRIDFENNTVTFPDFVYTEKRTIPGYTVDGVEMIRKNDGSIEISKNSFEVSQAGKSIIGKKLYGTVKGNVLEMEVVLRVGKMPFSLKVTYSGSKQ